MKGAAGYQRQLIKYLLSKQRSPFGLQSSFLPSFIPPPSTIYLWPHFIAVIAPGEYNFNPNLRVVGNKWQRRSDRPRVIKKPLNDIWEWVGMEIKSKLDLNLSLYQRHLVEPFVLDSFHHNVVAGGHVQGQRKGVIVMVMEEDTLTTKDGHIGRRCVDGGRQRNYSYLMSM